MLFYLNVFLLGYLLPFVISYIVVRVENKRVREEPNVMEFFFVILPVLNVLYALAGIVFYSVFGIKKRMFREGFVKWFFRFERNGEG